MPARRLVLAAALAALPVSVAPPTPARAQDARRLAEVRDQGVLYYKKQLFKQARRYLDEAYAMKGGPGDFPTVYYRALTAFAQGHVDEAHEMATIAERLAVDDRRKQAVAEIKSRVRALYGPVTFKPSPNESNRRGRIFFEAKTGIINKDKKDRFAAIQERYRSTSVTLPTTLFLPYGEYTANNVPFAVVEGAEKPPAVEIFLQVVEDEGGVTGGGLDGDTWMWIGIGSAAAIGLGVGAALLLGGDDEPPAGPVDVPFRGER